MHQKMLVVLQHGSHGYPRDFALLESLLRGHPGIVAMAPQSVVGRRTDFGTVACGRSIAQEIVAAVERVRSEIAAKHNHRNLDDVRVRLAVVGHSYGGILLREALHHMWVHHRPICHSIIFHSFITVSTPHCGLESMPSPWLKKVGRTVGKYYSQSYADMFFCHSTVLSGRLLEPLAMAPLRQFESRRVYAVCGDRLVSTSSAAVMPQNEAVSGSEIVELPSVDKYPQIIDISSLVESQTSSSLSDVDECETVSEEHRIAILLRRRLKWNTFLVDLSRGGVELPWYYVDGMQHRAAICKAPLFFPDVFGCTSKHIAHFLRDTRFL